MNKKQNKSNVWYLLPQRALRDKNLNKTDRNVLSVLVYLNQAFVDGDGYFFRSSAKLSDDMKDAECPLSTKQISRCISKLNFYGYIEYIHGFKDPKNGVSKCSRFRILKPTDNEQNKENNVHLNCNCKFKVL